MTKTYVLRNGTVIEKESDQAHPFEIIVAEGRERLMERDETTFNYFEVPGCRCMSIAAINARPS